MASDRPTATALRRRSCPQPRSPGNPSAVSPTSASSPGSTRATRRTWRRRRPRRQRPSSGPAHDPRPRTHWHRSLSRRDHDPLDARVLLHRAAEASASSASSSTIGHAITPSARGRLERQTGPAARVDAVAGLVAGDRSLRNDSMTWSVATPAWVTPSPSAQHRAEHPPARATSRPARSSGRRAEEVAEQLVGAVDQVHLHAREPPTPGFFTSSHLRSSAAIRFLLGIGSEPRVGGRFLLERSGRFLLHARTRPRHAVDTVG